MDLVGLLVVEVVVLVGFREVFFVVFLVVFLVVFRVVLLVVFRVVDLRVVDLLVLREVDFFDVVFVGVGVGVGGSFVIDIGSTPAFPGSIGSAIGFTFLGHSFALMHCPNWSRTKNSGQKQPGELPPHSLDKNLAKFEQVLSQPPYAW